MTEHANASTLDDMSRPVWPEQGWYGDADDPSSVIYWTGEKWDGRAPRVQPAGPEPVWVRARPVALGVLVALLVFVYLF